MIELEYHKFLIEKKKYLQNIASPDYKTLADDVRVFRELQLSSKKVLSEKLEREVKISIS